MQWVEQYLLGIGGCLTIWYLDDQAGYNVCKIEAGAENIVCAFGLKNKAFEGLSQQPPNLWHLRTEISSISPSTLSENKGMFSLPEVCHLVPAAFCTFFWKAMTDSPRNVHLHSVPTSNYAQLGLVMGERLVWSLLERSEAASKAQLKQGVSAGAPEWAREMQSLRLPLVMSSPSKGLQTGTTMHNRAESRVIPMNIPHQGLPAV